MGANTSTVSEQDRDRVLRRVSPQFSQDEGQAIKRLFAAIAGGPDKKVYGESNLKVGSHPRSLPCSPTLASPQACFLRPAEEVV